MELQRHRQPHMLSTSYRAVPSSCLRCQLRSVISQGRYVSPAPCQGRAKPCDQRSLHVAQRRGQEPEGRDRGYRPFILDETASGLSENLDDGDGRDERNTGQPEHQATVTRTNEGDSGLPDHQEKFRRTDNGDLQLPEHQDKSKWRDRGGRGISRPLGQMYGKGDRRHRETSTTLQSPAMGKPFEITIMHDTLEGLNGCEDHQGRHDSPVKKPSGERIARNIVALDEAPSQEEVQDSIEALRPTTTILDDRDFAMLARELNDRYNRKQLSRYLTAKLRLDEIDGDLVYIKPRPLAHSGGVVQRSLWQVGRSPISERVSLNHEIRKSAMGKSKKAIGQQILRVAWNLHSSAELQSIGELELSLTSWQFTYLFTLSGTGQPLHQAMITTPLLLKTSEIRPYEPDKIMRIVARRRDAEEIADQIDRALHELSELDTDLTVFKSLFEPEIFHAQLKSIFNPSRCADVGRRTSTVIELVNRTHLVIRGRKKEDSHLARRTMLRFLNLPSSSTFETHELMLPRSLTRNKATDQKRTFSLEGSTSELHFQHRTLRLGREVIPRRRSTKLPSNSPPSAKVAQTPVEVGAVIRPSRFTSSRDLERYLSELPPFIPFEGRPAQAGLALWLHPSHITPAPWRLELGKRLSQQSRRDGHASQIDGTPIPHEDGQTRQPSSSVMQTFLPDQARLLSYFSPSFKCDGERSARRARGISHKSLHAHFIPSPFGKNGVDAMRILPRVEVIYDTSLAAPSFGPTRIRARLSRQEVRVTLPGEALDLCFVRDISIKGTTQDFNDLGLGDFHRIAWRAIEAGQDLEYCNVVNMRLPAWLEDPAASEAGETVQVPYLFDGFDAVQSANFRPNEDTVAKGGIKSLLNTGREPIFLRYREVDSGPIGGRRNETSVRCKYLRTTGSAPVADNSALVVEAGLEIASAFTEFASGKLKARWELRDGGSRRGGGSIVTATTPLTGRLDCEEGLAG